MRQSGTRPYLYFGGERAFVLLVMAVTAYLVFVVVRWEAALAGIGFFLVAMAILRRLAAIDPLFSKVYRRQLRLQSRYRAFSTPWSQCRPPPSCHDRD